MKRPAMRAAARVAWRGARRDRRRSILVVVMIAMPVTLVTATATVARTLVGSPEDEVVATMGAADLMLSVGQRFSDERVSSVLPPGTEAVSITSTYTDVVEEGQLRYATLAETDQPLTHPLFRGLYELVAGRSPERAGEAVVNPAVLDAYDARVGSEIDLRDHELTITGTIRTRDLDELVAVAGSGTLKVRDASRSILIGLPAETSVEDALAKLDVHSVTTRADIADTAARDGAVWDAVSLVGGALALFATGLIAAAAFVVRTRRQLRELGLVGAAGGEPRHVRAIVLLGGACLGLIGGLVGSATGVAVAAALHPLLDDVVRRHVSPLDVNPLVLVAVVGMGTTAATLAALGPARLAARLTVMAALSGRTPPPRRPGRIAAVGLVVVVVGGVVAAWATVRDQNVLLAFGLIAIVVGVLLAIPMLVSFAGLIAGRLPLSGRIAARDAARYGRRTGAAVAAAVVALATPVAVATYSLSEETYEQSQPRLGEDMLLVGQLSDVSVHGATDDAAREMASAFPDALTVPLRQAAARARPRGQKFHVYAFGAKETIRPGVRSLSAWPLFIADEDLLRAVHADPGIAPLRDGKALVLGGFETNNRFIRINLPGGGGGERRVKMAAVSIDSPAYFNESIPRMVISEQTAEELGLTTHIAQYLMKFPRPVAGGDVDRARAVAEDYPGFYVNSNDDYLPKYALARNIVTAATVPLGLAVLAVAVALVTSESRRSHQILVAVGAGPQAHRRIVGASSALLAGIAALLAVPAGLLPTFVVQAANQAGRPLVVPWLTISIVVLVTPLLSGAVAGALGRSPRLGTLLTPPA